jgi:hypothetical protein
MAAAAVAAAVLDTGGDNAIQEKKHLNWPRALNLAASFVGPREHSDIASRAPCIAVAGNFKPGAP